MLESIVETREKDKNGNDYIKLEIPEKTLYSTYDEPIEEAIKDLAKRYLIYIEEESIPVDIEITKDDENEKFIVKLEIIS